MHCTSCGNEISEGVKFCGACGSPVEQSSIIQQVAQPIQKTDNQQPIRQDVINDEEIKPSPDGKYAVMSVGGYMGSMFVMSIPIIGWIIAIIWACGGSRKVNKRNLARATIIWTIIIAGIFTLIGFAITSLVKTAWKGISEAAGISKENFSITSLLNQDGTGNGEKLTTEGFDIKSIMELFGGSENGGLDLNTLQNMEIQEY